MNAYRIYVPIIQRVRTQTEITPVLAMQGTEGMASHTAMVGNHPAMQGTEGMASHTAMVGNHPAMQGTEGMVSHTAIVGNHPAMQGKERHIQQGMQSTLPPCWHPTLYLCCIYVRGLC